MDNGEQKVGEVITLRKSVNVIHKEAADKVIMINYKIEGIGSSDNFEKEWMEVVFHSCFSLLSSYLWLIFKNLFLMKLFSCS